MLKNSIKTICYAPRGGGGNPFMVKPFIRDMRPRDLVRKIKARDDFTLWAFFMFVLSACGGGGGGGAPKIEVASIPDIIEEPTDGNEDPPPDEDDNDEEDEDDEDDDDEDNVVPEGGEESTSLPDRNERTFTATKEPDVVDGNKGYEYIDYRDSKSGIEVKLSGEIDSNGYVTGHTGGYAENDKMKNIDHIYGTDYADDLIGNQNANIIYAGGWFDEIYGLGGDDFLHGGRSNDYIDGGMGADTIDGGDGLSDYSSYFYSNEAVILSLSNSIDDDGFIRGQSGGYAEGDRLKNIENLVGSQFDDVLIGDLHNNRLEGGDGADIIEGRAGRDTLMIGDDGNNILNGDHGVDRLTGGAGNDIFILDHENNGMDIITDFTKGEDKLQLYMSGHQDFNHLSETGIHQRRDEDEPSNLIISWDGFDIVMLENYGEFTRVLFLRDFDIL